MTSHDAQLGFRGVRFTALAGLIGVIITASASTVTGFITYSATKENSQSKSQVAVPTLPPRVAINSIEWLDNSGHFAISGSVENLGNHQLIWTYNEPYDPKTGAPGPVYPDPGPCPVDSHGKFACQLGFAGSPADDGHRFAFLAAVVTDADAYDAATVKSGEEGRHSYPNAVSVPHVEGDEPMDSMDKTRP